MGGERVRGLDASVEQGASRVVALVPAHNEQEQIAATVRSLLSQTAAPHRVIVMADNCSDDTVAVAREAGAMAIETVGNHGKKAGALNQGIDLLLPELEDDDLLLLMDADSVLSSEWVERGRDYLEAHPEYGAVSGAYVARPSTGLLPLLQQAEYAQERRRTGRRMGRVDVLSGTATLLPVSVIRQLKAARGFVYDETSLTEDFEITLAIRQLGYSPHCFLDLKVVTDVMETWGDLAKQRIRWQRGTLETLRAYGWSPLTRRLWLTQTAVYGSSAATGLVILAWLIFFLGGGQADPRWLAVVPVFALEQWVTSRRAGRRAAAVAALLLPMWLYDMFRLAVYWTALFRSLRRTTATWA